MEKMAQSPNTSTTNRAAGGRLSDEQLARLHGGLPRRRNWRNVVLIGLYLLAIVIANLSVAYFGPKALIVTAFLLIPFDLCTRDILHESWQDGHLMFKMACLIASGSIVSFILYQGSGKVALASLTAFLAAGWIDTAVYQLARGLARGWRMNLSNFFSAVTDSLIFPLVAFGSTTFMLSGTQALAKFVGGIFWTFLFLRYLRHRISRTGYFGALPVVYGELPNHTIERNNEE